MPILRYFLFVGGTLFALLILADAVLPSVPLPTNLTAASDLPPVRIKSDRKWPERIVMDSSMPSPVTIAKAEPPAIAAAAEAVRSNPRDAFAQMKVTDSRREAAVSEAPRTAAKTSEAATRSAASPKRKIAKARPGKPMILVAQQPHAGGFFTTW
ncbi:hypothetical protein [Bradyrhizobium sp. STM 3809]|uniref:hypothetical protein n=1 Tax=Bradyrhizobium sp. STM 3809 TaxID=551936 RepID=UPI00055761D0|nr:hypothetical protein [Bradyrhizobium sp. STM 3809]